MLGAGMMRLCEISRADWSGIRALRVAVHEERPAVVAMVEVQSRGSKGANARAHAESIVGWGGL